MKFEEVVNHALAVRAFRPSMLCAELPGNDVPLLFPVQSLGRPPELKPPLYEKHPAPHPKHFIIKYFPGENKPPGGGPLLVGVMSRQSEGIMIGGLLDTSF